MQIYQAAMRTTEQMSHAVASISVIIKVISEYTRGNCLQKLQFKKKKSISLDPVNPQTNLQYDACRLATTLKPLTESNVVWFQHNALLANFGSWNHT